VAGDKPALAPAVVLQIRGNLGGQCSRSGTFEVVGIVNADKDPYQLIPPLQVIKNRKAPSQNRKGA
jgi:hypothetical protein